MMFNSRTICFFVLLVVFSISGCRGGTSPKPPVHPNLNMDQQNRIDPQEPNDFFSDKRGMRSFVEGTVPQGSLNADDHLYRGKSSDGTFAATLPEKDGDGNALVLDVAFLQRGAERYGVYCVPCHDGAGTGDGIVVQRGMLKPPSFHDERVRGLPVGALYDIVTNGIRNMSPYRSQLALRDRWAVASYVRALQLSRSGTLENVPAEKAASQRWEIR